MENHYNTLGVSRTSTQDEIKKAYKKLAFQYHPDKNQNNPEAEEKFKSISTAYDNIGDADKRKIYDSKMAWGMDFSRWGHAFGTSETANGFSKAAKVETPKGSDVTENVIVTLAELATGVDRVIKISRMGACSTCSGIGAKTTKTCSTCKGNGIIQKIQKVSAFANSITTDTCSSCWGAGVETDLPCNSCSGTGLMSEDKSIKLNIPLGFVDGEVLRIPGLGNNGSKGGRAGDLYVKVIQTPHPIFKRDGKNLFCTATVSYVDLILGVNQKVETLFDSVEFKIPEGTQPGSKFRIKDKGIAGGALFVEVLCQIPTAISAEQKKHCESLRNLEKEFDFDSE